MLITHLSITVAFFTGIAGLTFYRTHLLSALLCLEGTMISLYVALATWALEHNSTVFSISPMILLALSACEAGAGLALLVATSRTHGSDHINALNLLQC